jgi:cyclophilin family peptidyl-prolyl cis-trans isomerase/HEAT repeat protein
MKMAAMLGAAVLIAQAATAPRVTLDRLEQAAQQQGVSEPLDVLQAEKSWAGADVLLPLATSENPQNRLSAIRALGRLEDPRLVPQLLALGNSPATPPGVVATAIAQSLRGFDPARDPELIARVSTWLRRVAFVKTGNNVTALPEPIGNIVYGDAEQVHGAEDVLRRILDDSAYDRRKQGTYLAAARSLEALGRLNAKVTTFDEETVTRLARMVVKTLPNDDLDPVRENALAALISARALDAGTEKQALKDIDWQVRRLAMSVASGAGAGIGDEERLDLIADGLSDPSGQVRYEALRGFVRRGARPRGCGPIVSLLTDQDPHVVLAAIDALGDLCKEDEAITTRLIAEARTPPASAWQREAHAFVALAKRSPEAAAISMEAFVTHPAWWVRMYAARAAAAVSDVIRLDKLAFDTNDNVREAALGPLYRLKKADADAAIIAALERNDVQLLRTASTLVKESPRNERFGRPLMAALQRLTKEGKETSRDARLPLLEAITVHARPGDATELERLLKDFDPQVAAKTADVMTRLTGKTAIAAPKPPVRNWPPSLPDLRQCVVVSLSSGPSFRLVMNPGAAPMTVDRFLKLAAIDHYYDGLTIHRIAPNFVIQGGGPGANEYAGHKDFMRDEIGAANTRGTVGLSTRGRNTADAQFFINLVDNRRLDGDYTVFASVPSADMPVVDRIQEGDVMRLSMMKCAGQ